MKKRIILVIILLLSLAATFALGAEWSVGWSGADRGFEQLTMADDKDYQFKVDRFLCKASKISLVNIQNEIFESRFISCQIAKETYVSTDLSYNMNGQTCMDTRSLIIYDIDKTYVASLFVKCK